MNGNKMGCRSKNLEGNKTLMILFNFHLHNVWRKKSYGSNKQAGSLCVCAQSFSFLLRFQFPSRA